MSPILTRPVSLPDSAVPWTPAAPPADCSGPALLLLGPLQLRHAAGRPPGRARQSCLEYLAWLLDHPGAPSSQMRRDLLVAEGTRRSNLSRLRSWLGKSPDGELYLPEAYSGRIQLHPGVTSDWQNFELLLARGSAATSTDRLVAALNLVRGAPLADASAAQWSWLEPARAQLSATIRQASAELADRALAADDLDVARWALGRADCVGPDETLFRLRLRVERRAGHDSEVQRLAAQLWRRSARTGLTLASDTLELLQELADRGPRLAFSGQPSLW